MNCQEEIQLKDSLALLQLQTRFQLLPTHLQDTVFKLTRYQAEKKLVLLKKEQTVCYMTQVFFLTPAPHFATIEAKKQQSTKLFPRQAISTALILSTAEKGSNHNYSSTHYIDVFRDQANPGKVPR